MSIKKQNKNYGLLKAQIQVSILGAVKFLLLFVLGFSFLLAVPSSMQDPARDQPAVEARSLNYWTVREIPEVKYFLIKVSMLLFKRHCAASYLQTTAQYKHKFSMHWKPESSCDLVYCNSHFLFVV